MVLAGRLRPAVLFPAFGEDQLFWQGTAGRASC